MAHKQLNRLILTGIENDVPNSFLFVDVLKKFASNKLRKTKNLFEF